MYFKLERNPEEFELHLLQQVHKVASDNNTMWSFLLL